MQPALARGRESIDAVRTLLLECRAQAAGERHYVLTYLIEMAYVQASDLARRLHETSLPQ
jgi:hypothetical protein